MSEHIGFSRVSDRFGFRATGTFKCPRKGEGLMLAAVAAIYTLCLCITVLNMIEVLSRDNSMPIFAYDRTVEDFSPTVDLLCVIASVFIMLVLTAASIAAVIVIIGGVVYNYTADDEKMTVTDPKGEKTVFYYCDTESVTYERLTLFSARQRGFDVYIKTKYRTYNYQIIFGRNKLFRQEKHTPFFILEERAGLKTRRYTDEMGV